MFFEIGQRSLEFVTNILLCFENVKPTSLFVCCFCMQFEFVLDCMSFVLSVSCFFCVLFVISIIVDVKYFNLCLKKVLYK